MNISYIKKNERCFVVRNDVLVCLFILLAIIAIYWPVGNHEFINFDDDIYFNENHVKDGLTLDGFKWAFSFTAKENTYWHPLTWLSFMLSYELYGPNPGMHHSISLIIHIINSLLLFIVLRRMTGALWKSAFVAALFALHPLNVESVAWVTQRPNILSTLFWMLTLLVYSYYTDRPGIFRYLLMVIVFVLGLMAKPMLITLPFVLFLLDYWPLKRLRFPLSQKALLLLILEKIPLIAISMGSVFITIKSIGAVVSTATVPVNLRIANALVSYVGYIWKMIWPHNLSVYYPYPSDIPAWKFAGAGLLLVCLSVFIILILRKQPYLTVGWLWFLGTLVPVIGLIQTGLQPALADRYAYVSFIGLFIMLAWGIPEVLRGWQKSKIVLGIFSIALVLILMMTTWLQLIYWKNSEKLFKHALEVTTKNYVAHNNLGIAFKEKGKLSDAFKHYNMALKIKPDFEIALLNIGVVLANLGYDKEAIKYYIQALKLKPDYLMALVNLGNALLRQGNVEDATGFYFKALKIEPDFAEAYNGLGAVMVRKGMIEKAVEHFKKALQLKPDFEGAKKNLEKTLAAMGNINKMK